MVAKRKKQFNPPVGSPAHEARMERQRARRAVDAKAKKNGEKRYFAQQGIVEGGYKQRWVQA